MKNLFFNRFMLLPALFITPGIYGAASSSDEAASSLLRKSAREAFFDQLSAVRSKQFQGTAQRTIVKRTLEKVNELRGIGYYETPIDLAYFGLSIQDLIDHALMPNLNPVSANVDCRQRSLDISHMHIDDLTGIEKIKGTQDVIELDLSHNRIPTIPSGSLRNFKNLLYLYLSNNKFKTLQKDKFISLTRLESLDLTNNQIQDIQPGAFTGLNRLEKLLLGNNQIRDMQPDALQGLCSLITLNLVNNQLPKTSITRDTLFSILLKLRRLSR